ncbi:uncharacterized protein LOC126909222 isoform X1 [Daktulosphaira vitifoliae]|uniref:uncharacterized protein LOC126909222 isoform X1 n=1 Tax=Daktulosphaira vitifoliae TaxID=58002 RepID=UPI0021AA1AFD|nr:uncharacterized protein LOC126909222 isoform X1 [Daktulosphaira vitifoliae]
MLPKLFYFICYTLWILTSKCFVSCKIRPKTYEKYYIEVMDHISEQVGWDFMQYLEVDYGSSTEISSNIKNIICKESNVAVSKKFDAIIHFLNYMYAEVIKTFNDHISTIANRCQEYYDLNQGDNLLSCTVLLQSAVENSKTMFEQLYNVMNYLSNIDFKLLAKWKKTFSVPIVDEIYTFVEYATLKSQQNTQIFVNPNDPNTKNVACEVILDVKTFIEGKGFKTYQKIKKKNSLVYNYNPICLLEDNLKNYKALQNKNIELSQYLCEWLKIYYNEISKYLYKNLGFEEVLELKEESYFTPPVHMYKNNTQKQRIRLINEITKESGWKSLKPINIVFNDQVISVERILRHPTDKLNFHCKKQHILRVIKCIYTEILFKYCDYVIFLLDFCETELLNPYDALYINFVRQVFDAVHKTINIFDIMYKTLVSLNILLGEYLHDNCYSNIKCLCNSITKLLEEINSGNYSLDDLDSKCDQTKQKIPKLYTRTYVKNISKFLKYNKTTNRSLFNTHEKQFPVQNLVLNIDIPETISTNNFSSACNELIVFSKKFINVYYEEVGLNKLN